MRCSVIFDSSEKIKAAPFIQGQTISQRGTAMALPGDSVPRHAIRRLSQIPYEYNPQVASVPWPVLEERAPPQTFGFSTHILKARHEHGGWGQSCDGLLFWAIPLVSKRGDKMGTRGTLGLNDYVESEFHRNECSSWHPVHTGRAS